MEVFPKYVGYKLVSVIDLFLLPSSGNNDLPTLKNTDGNFTARIIWIQCPPALSRAGFPNFTFAYPASIGVPFIPVKTGFYTRIIVAFIIDNQIIGIVQYFI